MLLSTTCAILLLASPFSIVNAEEARDLRFNLAYDYGEAAFSSFSAPLYGRTPIHAPDDPLIVFNSIDTDRLSLSEHTGDGFDTLRPGRIRAVPTLISRPRSNFDFQRARLSSLRYSQSTLIEWEEVEVLGPDIEDRITLLELAKITGNAYALNVSQPNWYPLDPKWNTSTPFGWAVDEDGFRGHVFATPDNSTVILSIKGTTLSGAGPTAKKDRFNDNRLFSCCCGYVNWSWRMRTVCDCYSGGYRCDNQCLHEALLEESVFYNTGVNLYNNLTYLYPTANIWIVGHSLGGALASLLGATFGAPVVAFESPGERLAAQRLHLPNPKPSRYANVSTYHIYHTADPIPSGACTGVHSLCASGGYALETRCHLGKTILYDTIGKLGWSASLRSHTIKTIVTKILNEDWEDVAAGGRAVPEAIYEENCTECFKWEFDDYHTTKALDTDSSCLHKQEALTLVSENAHL
ncbi:putative lipase atg15 [Tulasnella sp. JGI-2019a]|nr:putative lipase atg15 [Tulasnella sp. JGI-2019a]